MKWILFISFLHIGLVLQSQVDSTWQSSLKIQWDAGLIPSNRAKYEVLSLEFAFKKQSYTLLPKVAQKTIHNIKGMQLGTAFYKESKWGYMDATVVYSNSNIFPTWSILGEGHVNLTKGLSMMTGVKNHQYKNGDRRSVLSLGPTYYLNSWMGSYVVNISNNTAHRLVTRRYLSALDYIQVGFYYGSFEDLNTNGVPTEVESNTIQIALNKTIWKKIQLQCSFSSVGTSSDNKNSRFINLMLALKKIF